MSYGNWALLFLEQDELETTFNAASKKKKKVLWERQKKKIKKEKNANLLPFLRLMK